MRFFSKGWRGRVMLVLAVVDDHGRLAGIITADDVITMLRHE